MDFTSDADFSKLVRVEVDGNVVDPANYTAWSGSTKVRLKGSYTATLSVGKHILSIISADGVAKTTFTITKPTPPPKTGDNTTPLLWLALALVGCTGVLTALRGVKRRRA